MPTNKSHFELIVLGCSGGPISGKTCAFLLKPQDKNPIDYIHLNYNEKSDDLLAIDAGTGLTSIFRIMKNRGGNIPDNPSTPFLVDMYPNYSTDSDSISHSLKYFVNLQNMQIKLPFSELHETVHEDLTDYQLTDKLLNSINGYLITHPHLDHVASLVINSPAFKMQTRIYGLESTTTSIKNNLFNDSIWPDFVNMNKIKMNSLLPNKWYSDISKRYSIRPFEISHGCHLLDKSRYFSAAFLINDLKNDYNILFFGDVESDLESHTDYNFKIWTFISPLIINNKLNSIIIECSTPDIQPPLFGHMIPSHLIYEFLILRKSCIDLANPSIREKSLSHDDEIYKDYRNQPLSGLNVIIIHVKETLNDINPRKIILESLNHLNVLHNLQINFTIALPGISYIL